MPRIQPVTEESANAKTEDILANVKRKMGMLPNLIATMAHSPAVVNAYLSFSQSLGTGRLPVRLREQIALVVGETNTCGYCVAAHSALGRQAGLSESETVLARRGQPTDARERAAITLARTIVTNRGLVSDEDVRLVREAGYDDAEICEIVAHVALNLFTNYFNHLAGTEIDFPAVPNAASY